MKRTKNDDGSAQGGAPEEVIEKVNNLFRQYGHAINERGLLNLLDTMARDLAAVAPAAPPASSAVQGGGEAGGGLLSLLLDGEPLAFDLPTPVAVIKNVRAEERSLKERGWNLDLGKLLEEQLHTADGARVDLVAARWTSTNSRKGHLTHTMAELSESFDQGLPDGAAPLRIELSGAAAKDLARVAIRLGIQPEAWLKAEVMIQARRGARMGDCEARAKRNAAREARQARMAEECERRHRQAKVVSHDANFTMVRIHVPVSALDSFEAVGHTVEDSLIKGVAAYGENAKLHARKWSQRIEGFWSDSRCLRWMKRLPKVRVVDVRIPTRVWGILDRVAFGVGVNSHDMCLGLIGSDAYMMQIGAWRKS